MSQNDNLKQKTFSGVIWNYVNSFGTSLLQLLPAMILARLLNPEDYGVVAMAAIFTGLVSMFINSGFAMAIIQKQDLEHVDICSIFYFNIFMSFIVYAILFFIAPFCASFFNMPDVCTIMRVSSIGLVIGSSGSVHGTLLKKELNFKTLTQRNLLSTFIAALIAVVLALMDFGYWALVAQGITSTTLTMILNWYASKWRPTLVCSISRLADMFKYGSRLLLKGLNDYFFDKAYDVAIGKFYSASDLSYFNRAYSAVGLFVGTFLDVLNNVAFPSFSKMQADFERMRTNVIRFMRIESMIMFFIMTLIMSLAEPFFHFMYSSKWDEVIPLFQSLCIWGLLRPVAYVFANGLMAKGFSGPCLKVSFICRVLNVLFLLVTWRFGLMVMIMGQICATLIEDILYTWQFRKVFNYGYRNLIKDLYLYLLIGLFIAGVVFMSDRLLSGCLNTYISSEFAESVARLLCGGILGVFLFLLINRTFKPKVYCDFKGIVLDVMKAKPQIYLILNELL